METKACTLCREHKSLDDFHRHPFGRSGRQSRCKPCASQASGERYHALSPREKWDRWLRNKFNITADQWEAMYEAQGGLCALCFQPQGRRRFSVDHDHACCPTKTKSCGRCIRGLTHATCNSLLGLANDDIGRLEQAIAYLKKVR